MVDHIKQKHTVVPPTAIDIILYCKTFFVDINEHFVYHYFFTKGLFKETFSLAPKQIGGAVDNLIETKIYNIEKMVCV